MASATDPPAAGGASAARVTRSGPADGHRHPVDRPSRSGDPRVDQGEGHAQSFGQAPVGAGLVAHHHGRWAARAEPVATAEQGHDRGVGLSGHLRGDPRGGGHRGEQGARPGQQPVGGGMGRVLVGADQAPALAGGRSPPSPGGRSRRCGSSPPPPRRTGPSGGTSTPGRPAPRGAPAPPGRPPCSPAAGARRRRRPSSPGRRCRPGSRPAPGGPPVRRGWGRSCW